jgi:peptidoglycan/LPS O-acetylase OafA/YrhL
VFVLTRSTQSPSEPAPAADTSIPISRHHLAALDGVRFIAAFTVLAGHGYGYVVQQAVETSLDPIAVTMRALPGLGMTLFFVLSGFVIHFNYHMTVGVGRGGNFDFFIARFSRLYPLFLAVFAIDLVHILSVQGYFTGRPQFNFDPFGPLPFFLSFTQTWLFIPFAGHPIYEHYGYATSTAQATGAMWSLSTEWLFYVFYPALSVWLRRRSGKGLALLAGITAVAGLTYYGWCAYHTGDIRKFALTHFGSASLADAFVGWMVFYTPIGRMVEFLLGAIAAQAYLSRPNTAGLLERLPRWTTAALAALILVWTPAPSLLHWQVAGVSASCAVALVALFVLLVVQHRTRIADILSAPLLVKCGEASYSLYLLHWYTMHQWVAPYAYPLGGGGRIALFFVGMAISVILARVVYLLFEKPALRWLRRNFKPLRLHLVLGAVFVAITCLSVAASLQTHAVQRFCEAPLEGADLGEIANTKPDCSSLGILPAQRPPR